MTTKTFRLSGRAIERQWHVVDAAGRPLGRVASEAAQLLLGKHKPTYEPHLPMGDHVIIVNAGKVELTGAKREQKVYYRHTGYPGGLRERSFEEQMERDPRKVIERAVKGMLPHNARGRQLFRMLKVYAGPDHPHEAQVRAGTGARALKAQRRAEEGPAAAAAPATAAVEESPATETPTPETPPAEAPIEAVRVGEPEAVEAPAVEQPDATEAAVEASLPGDGESEAALRLSGSLNRYKREELGAEAERLGITIESGWNKPEVVEAIQQYYDEHPVEDEE